MTVYILDFKQNKDSLDFTIQLLQNMRTSRALINYYKIVIITIKENLIFIIV